jgi:hypothetical protein
MDYLFTVTPILVSKITIFFSKISYIFFEFALKTTCTGMNLCQRDSIQYVNIFSEQAEKCILLVKLDESSW